MSVDAGLLLLSDRGSQYASGGFRQLLDGCGVIQSMGRKGNCWDNAVAESFFATLKNEETSHVYETKASAHRAIASYIHGFYNTTRLLGYQSPNDYAQRMRQAA